jgi:transcriptional regulator with XRE-family HTH domain
MDNERFGSFLARLRREQGLTQKELADRLNVTDKAVSKWETGKGFPDVKLLEPLAQALGVSLVELMQGKRQEADTLTVAEADAAVSQALGQSDRAVTRRYLRLFRWFLAGGGGLSLLWLFTTFFSSVWAELIKGIYLSPAAAQIIGGADGPTAIITATATLNPMETFFALGVPLLLLIVCAVLAVKVWRLEKKLK